MLWDPQDGEEGYLITSDNPNSLRTEFTEFAAGFEDVDSAPVGP
ncbi:hypothetical protein Salmuc_03826 [Salipiger mucosus DSM 16094]|uniref:Uncharacterized protein n=1 Tax=Salipiger mucosus DSM 16094 TaxID=1123237 RepID=S9S2W8_9RHOB|nr:hypothetical protein Salmuc_03826 [Salipiger mucosus DSM 16094]